MYDLFVNPLKIMCGHAKPLVYRYFAFFRLNSRNFGRFFCAANAFPGSVIKAMLKGVQTVICKQLLHSFCTKPVYEGNSPFL